MANEILAENIAFDENGLYIPQTWLDGVGEENFTPMTADRMNHIEQGIKGLSDAWDSQSQPVLIGSTECEDSKEMEDIGALGDFNWYILTCCYRNQKRILATILIPRAYMIAASNWMLAHTARHNEDYSAGCMHVNGRIKACIKGFSRAEVWGLA